MSAATCYHCSRPIDNQSIGDDGAPYHPRCYATAARQESCAECGATGPDAFVVAAGDYLAPIHGGCIAVRASRLAESPAR